MLFACGSLKIPTEEQLGQNLLSACVNLHESNTGTRARDHLYLSVAPPLPFHPADLKLLTLDRQPHWEDNCCFQGSTRALTLSVLRSAADTQSDGIDVNLKSVQ